MWPAPLALFLLRCLFPALNHGQPPAPAAPQPQTPAFLRLLPSEMASREGKTQTTCSSHGSKGIWVGNDHVKSSPTVTARWIEPSHTQTSRASWSLGPNPIASTQCWAPSGLLQSQQEFVRSLAANVCLWSFTGRARVPEIEGPSAYRGRCCHCLQRGCDARGARPEPAAFCSLPWHVAALPVPAGFCLVSVCLG